MNILIQRSGALGDVIMATPIAMHFLNQGDNVYFETHCPGVFQRSGILIGTPPKIDRFINLDLAYERRPKMHVIDAYALEAKIELKNFKTHLHRVENIYSEVNKFVVLHAGVGWPSRTLPHIFWFELAEILKAEGYTPICIGTGLDYKLPNTLNIRDLSIHSLAGLIQKSKGFIGIDSGVMHIAGTTDTPMVGLFTCAKAEYRMPAHNYAVGINAPVDCNGCLHEIPAPVTDMKCKFGDNHCTRSFVPRKVFHVLESLVNSQAQDLSYPAGASGKGLSEAVHWHHLPHNNKPQ